MEFIEFTGRTLQQILDQEHEILQRLDELGVHQDSVLRINRQGDIELRRPNRWDVIGGLLGQFEERVRRATGLDWVEP